MASKSSTKQANIDTCAFHGLDALACSYSETMSPFRHLGRTPWTGDRPIARPLPKLDSTTQRNADI